MSKKWYEKSLEELGYNPFKMWGSFIGLVIGFILILFLIYGPSGSSYDIVFINNYIRNLQAYASTGIISFIVFLIAGFLIGWGIHSLIRSLRK